MTHRVYHTWKDSSGMISQLIVLVIPLLANDESVEKFRWVLSFSVIE